MIVGGKPSAVILGGDLYAEVMLIIEGAASVGATTLAANTCGPVAGYAVACADYYMFPTEIYAAGAFLTGDPAMIGSIGGTDVTVAIFVIFILVTMLSAVGGFMGLFNWLVMG
jgi:hypothetical protein